MWIDKDSYQELTKDDALNRECWCPPCFGTGERLNDRLESFQCQSCGGMGFKSRMVGPDEWLPPRPRR